MKLSVAVPLYEDFFDGPPRRCVDTLAIAESQQELRVPIYSYQFAKLCPKRLNLDRLVEERCRCTRHGQLQKHPRKRSPGRNPVSGLIAFGTKDG